MNSLFQQAIREYNEHNRGHPQYDCWLNYALSTNERGHILVDAIRRYVLSFRSKRFLDIGCGYGGVCIAAAEAGAYSIGIDLDVKLLEFAELNRADHPGSDSKFIRMDILDWGEVQKLEQFDLISCDNVIEHVTLPETMVMHIQKLLTNIGIAYLTIPNAGSLGQVWKDSHYGLTGICLLDTTDALSYVQHALGQPTYDVSVYLNFNQYTQLFKKYGLYSHLINACRIEQDSRASLSNKVIQIRLEYEKLKIQNKVPPSQEHNIAGKIDQHLRLYEEQWKIYDRLPGGRLKKDLSRRLMRDFRDEVWHVILARSPVVLNMRITLSRLKGGLRRIKKFLL